MEYVFINYLPTTYINLDHKNHVFYKKMKKK